MLTWQGVMAFEHFLPGCDRTRVLETMQKAMVL